MNHATAELAVKPTSSEPEAEPSHGPPSATDGRGSVYHLLDREVVVTSRSGRPASIRLDDPADVEFDGLPYLDLDDGRPLRTSAFLAWAAHVRALLAMGHSFETAHRPRRPYHTAFGVAGGVIVGAATIGVVLAWLHQPRNSWREPSTAEWVALLLLFGLLLAAGLRSFAAAGRMWTTRRGSFLRVDASGASFHPQGRAVPFDEIVAAVPHRFVRCTEVRLRDGTVHFVQNEPGPLVRPDLIFAALRD